MVHLVSTQISRASAAFLLVGGLPFLFASSWLAQAGSAYPQFGREPAE